MALVGVTFPNYRTNIAPLRLHMDGSDMQRRPSRRQLASGLAAALAGASTTTACSPSGGQAPLAGGSQDKPVEKAAARVALLLPLSASAQTAAVAKAMREAAELALFELRQSEVLLSVKDDQGTEDGARKAAEEAIAGGAEVILGPLFARSVRAAQQVARKAAIPLVAFSNDPSVAGNGTYLLSFSPAGETQRVVAFAARSGRRSFAALLPDDAEGKVIEPAFRASVQSAGASVAFIDRYTVESNGLVSAASGLKDLVAEALGGSEPLDALLLPGGQDTLPQLATLISQAGVDSARVKLLGTSGWDFSHVERNPRLAGGWFAAPDPRGWREFAERFGKTYRTMPPRIASLAHDAVLMAGALASGPKGARFTDQALRRASGFSGADGHFRFAESGIAERALAVLECRKTGTVVIDRSDSAAAPAGASMSLLGEGTTIRP